MGILLLDFSIFFSYLVSFGELYVIFCAGGSSVVVVSDDENMEEIREKMEKIGSTPPECVNKCRNCRPCMATLVVPSHQMMGSKAVLSHREDGSYYLLSWKCKCGNKLFQP